MKKYLLIIFTYLFVVNSLLMAATTGKIAGIITDTKTGETLPGVNVILEETQMGGATNAKGEYFIINIPPGVYVLKASYMGYSPKQVTNVRVNIDRTTTVDFMLDETVLDVGAEVTIVAEREKIRQDVSYSQRAISAEDIMAAPTGLDIRETISMGVGIQRDLFGHISIRGGEMDEVGFFVDDISMNDKRLGMPVIQVPKTAVQEVQVLTGGFNAEYGEARSGMINIVTKEASSSYHGSVDYRISPTDYKHFGPDIYSAGNYWAVGRFLTLGPSEDRDGDGNPDFQGWNAYMEANPDQAVSGAEGTIKTPEEALEVWKWRHRPLEYANAPDHFIEGTFGGPVPFTGNKMSFFYSGYYDHTLFPFRFSRPAFDDNTQTLKLKYQLSNNMTLRYTGNYGETRTSTYDAQPDRFINPHYWENVAYAQDGNANGHLYNSNSRMMETTIWRTIHAVDMTHTLNPSSFYEVKIQYDRTRYRSHPGDMRDRTIVKTVGDVQLDETPIGFSADKWKDLVSLHRLSEDKGWRDYSWYEAFDLRGDYTNQINTNHQLKAGLRASANNMNLKYGRDRWDKGGSRRMEQWTDRSVTYYEMSAYVQDKIEFEGMIMNLGLRADAFDPNEPAFSDPWSRYYGKEVNYDSLYYAPTTDAKTKWALSPRVGISHPISDNSKLFFNYGYFYQRGSVANLFTDVQQPRSNLDVMSNSELNYRKTISYELGVEQNIADLVTYKLTGYYKDVSGEIGSVDFDGIQSDIGYERDMNNRYKDIRGFEMELQMPRISYFSGWINYNYLIASSGWYGWNTIYEDTFQKNNLQSPNQSKPKARPWLRANLMFRLPQVSEGTITQKVLSDLMVSGYIQWRSGEWLTYHSDSYPGDEANNIHWKAWHNIDLNVSKGFDLFGLHTYAYMEVHNLLNSKHLTSNSRYYRYGAGFDDYLELVHEEGLEPGEFENAKVQDLMDKGYYFMVYGPKRDIWFGLRFEF